MNPEDARDAREVIERMDTKLRAARDAKEGEHRASLIARVIELRSEVRQMFTDAEHWNEHVRKPGVRRIDPDPDGLLKLLLQKLDAQVESWVQ